MWGVADIPEGDINFDWPRQEDLARFRTNKVPELSAITFWFKDNNTVCLRAIQFEHVGGELNSPLYDTGDPINSNIKVETATILETTSVSACCRDTQRDSIKSIAFHNLKTQLLEVNHYKREIGMQLATHNLNPGEEIIGGYGVSNKQRFITSFGFVVMQRSPI